MRPADTASSIRRTELSRATASGMNELGKRTVSRSGNTGSSAGTWNGCSADGSSAPNGLSRSLIGDLRVELKVDLPENPGR